MKKESLSVVFACFLGSLIGGLSALEINQYFAYGKYLWGVGALLGGLTAYVVVDFHEFRACLAKSYQESKENFAHKYKQIVGWEFDCEYWRTIASIEVGLFSLTSSCAIAAILFDYFAGFNQQNGHEAFGGLLYVCSFASFLSAAGCVTVMFTVPFAHKRFPDQKREQSLMETRQVALVLIKYCNPISFFFCPLYIVFTSLYYFGVALWQGFPGFIRVVIELSPFVWTACRQFFVNGFIYVHSERRTLCFVDATIGASFGFGFGSAIVGAFVGAMLGLVNYEFVSVRMLKLAPKKVK